MNGQVVGSVLQKDVSSKKDDDGLFFGTRMFFGVETEDDNIGKQKMWEKGG